MALFLTVLVPYVAGAEGPPKAKLPVTPATPPKAGSNKVVADRIAAVVGDSVILVSELDQRMMPLRTEAMSIPDQGERERRLAKLALQTLEEMVNDELILQAGIAAKLTIDQQEVQAAVDYIKQQNKMTEAEFVAAMKAQGITLATIKNDLLRQRAVNELVGRKLAVTDEDIRARYDELSRRSSAVAAVNVSQILFALPEHPTEQQLGDAKRRAHAAIDRIKGGEAFADVAGALSDDATTRSTGGMIGWLEPATLDPAWEAVVFGMDKGDVRGPISGAKGLYVLQANELKRNQLAPFDKMKEQLASELRRTQLTKLTRAWIEELRKKAYIEIKLQ
ncbi:MAG: peptidylprolyl isomerase [Deltaproteobacteria bacterium]|nr:peptidylprolyl isomerase [Deltaproteobacteria bacterium]